MKATEIKPDIYWVGAVDWAIRDFHGYITPNGTSYNNYLILDDEPVLLDTVKHEFNDVTIRHISSLIDPAKIKHVVVNHIENDHCSSLHSIMKLCPDAKIWITAKGKEGLARFYDLSHWNINVVKSGDTLKTGRKTLVFLETPMLHWPDSMMTYIPEDKLLISQDGFGQHLASTVRFDDEYLAVNPESDLDLAVIDYYANILMPFGMLVKSKLAEVAKLGLEIDMIAPDHGLIWRSHPAKILKMYSDMADGKAEEKALIIYDTMWHSTEQMTFPIVEGIKAEGVHCDVLKLRDTPMSLVITKFWQYRGTLIGAPTLNNLCFPPVMQLLTYLRGLRPKNRIVGGFGSYGWGGGSVKEMYETFKAMGLEAVEPGVEVKYRPSADDESKCYEFGKEFARRLKAYNAKF